MRCFLAALTVALVTWGTGLPAQAADWGDLTLQFVYDGDAPTPAPAKITKDIAFCGKHDVVDESLLVNAENQGVANVVMFLYQARGEDPPAVHPDYAKTAEDEVLLDNAKCRFEPHVTLLRTTQTLLVSNSDAVGHNTKVDTFTNPPINPIIPAGGKLPQTFSAPERLPAQVSCSIHPWMTAWVVIRDNPYMAVSDAHGKVSIKNLPAGEWTFQVWHEKSGYVSQVEQDGKDTEWTRGRVTVTVEPGQNDLGEIKLAPELFK